jgi:cold shock CspA family protein
MRKIIEGESRDGLMNHVRADAFSTRLRCRFMDRSHYMKVPLEVTCKGFARTEELDTLLTEKVEHLERYHPHIMSCRVGLERPETRARSGAQYYVRLSLRVPPGHEIVVRRGFEEGAVGNNLPTLIRQAFEAAERELRELFRQQHRQVKSHEEQAIKTGLIVRLFHDQGYGFIKLESGDEIYFHRNAVLHNKFERLVIGTRVRYVVEDGLKGLQASTVQIVDKPGASVGNGPIVSPVTQPPLGWEESQRRYDTLR